MDELKELTINTSGNLEYASICIDLPASSKSLGSEFRSQPKLDMMNNEEVELALSCAINIKKHLTRVLQNKSEAELQNKLQYVNNLLQEGGLRSSIN